MLSTVRVRPFREGSHSYAALTRLLNDAYAGLAAMGLNYVAATQDAAVTRQRIITASACWVAYEEHRLVGTICYYDQRRYESEPSWYGEDNVCHFGQFAVDPQLQRSGIGALLLSEVERRAIGDKKTEMSCDTAEKADHLIEYYRKRGLRAIGYHQWPHAKYKSVILSKRLDGPFKAVQR